VELTAERAGPYVRALRAALDVLAPNEDHVPLSAALDHLAALDPALSGTVLLPAEVSTRTGMPTYTWLERAAAEAALAARHPDPPDDEITRALALDTMLGERMAARRAVHRHLRGAELLPATRLVGAVRRRTAAGAEVGLAYDRFSPDGRWVRVRAEITLPGSSSRALNVDADGGLAIEESLQHLFTRQFATSAAALRAQLEDALGCRVGRLARGWIGPFWFPGVELPAGVPPALGEGLLLHASTEIVARDVRRSLHRDPFEPESTDRPPPGFGVFRERRFAAAGRALHAARALSPPVSVTPIRP
jgi:hypothetical protein